MRYSHRLIVIAVAVCLMGLVGYGFAAGRSGRQDGEAALGTGENPMPKDFLAGAEVNVDAERDSDEYSRSNWVRVSMLGEVGNEDRALCERMAKRICDFQDVPDARLAFYAGYLKDCTFREIMHVMQPG